MNKIKDFIRKYGRLAILIAIVILVVILVWESFGDTLPTYLRLLRTGDEAAIKEYVARESSWKGMASIVVMSALQVVSIVFPGFAIQIASGAIYGWWRSLLMCYGGFILGNALVFLIARRMGSEIQGFAPKKKKNISTSWIRDKMKTCKRHGHDR